MDKSKSKLVSSKFKLYSFSASNTAEPESEHFEKCPRDLRFGKRHLQIINICFLVFVAYYTRNNLAVAIVAMTDRNASVNSDIQTFNWTNKNVILSSFFIGYVPLQICSGFLVRQFNVKVLAATSLGISSFLGLLTPVIATHVGDKGVIAIRVLQGTTQGFVFPLVQHLLALWVPPTERAFLGGAVYAARPMATVLAMIIPGYLAASSFGWPWIFYTSNIMALIWCLSFLIFSYERPSAHPNLSKREQLYIEKSIGNKNKKRVTYTPFREILTSPPFWALTAAAFGYVWGFWTLQSQMPMYLKYVMKFDIKSSGAIAALPYLMQFLAGYVFSFISDYLLGKNVWSIGTARKTMNLIGCLGPALALVLLQSGGPEHAVKAIVLLTIAIATSGACFCGYTINHIDLSPNHSSVLVGISNGLAQSCGFLAPLFVQGVVTNEEDPSQWKIVFYTAAAINVVAGIIFAIFGSGKVQSWDSIVSRDKIRTQENVEDVSNQELLT
ncbi:putative inorganic phosphate cotransporter [Diabrotica undecimpunctata]|uniref:putative inorganic phosphate cotransporter n=1 Tax=Diabrotica undecimpunctata TaxID=50387 RepID=UPI003B632CEC